MIADAEKYKAEDAANMKRAEAKNGLENYCHSLQDRAESDEVRDNIHHYEKEELENAIQNTLNWLDINNVLDEDKYEVIQAALENFANAILKTVADRATGKPALEVDVPDKRDFWKDKAKEALKFALSAFLI